MRGFCATFATKSGAKKKGRLGRPRGKTGKTRRIGRTGKTRILVPPVPPVPPVALVPLVPLVPLVAPFLLSLLSLLFLLSLLPPCSRVSFLIPAPTRAHLKPSLSAFLQKNSARFSAFLQKIFCYLCIFNTRFSDHSCHPSHFFRCTHFTYLSHTYYYIRGRLHLLKKTQC